MENNSKKINTFENMLNWIKDNGGDFSEMQMKYLNEDNRYLISTKDLDKGQMINLLPEKILITKLIPEVKVYWEAISKIRFFEDFCEQQSICAWISQEVENPNSFWKPYFDFLPKDFSSFPYYFSEEELNYLKGSSFLEEVNAKKKQLNTEVEEIKKLNLLFYPENYIKARHLVYSRNFWIKIGKTQLSAVVPLADVFNYRPEEVNVKWTFDNDLNAYTVLSKRAIKKGEEILLDYGYHKNNHFLLYSGFTLSNNKGTEGKLNYSEVEDCPDFSLFEIDLNLALRNYRINKTKFTESYNDDYNALTILETKLKLIISKFGTTYEEDIKLLKNKKNLSYNMINILKVLIEEKKSINGYLKITIFFSDLIKNIISSNDYKIPINLTKTIQANAMYSNYFAILSKVNFQKIEEIVTFKQEELFI